MTQSGKKFLFRWGASLLALALYALAVALRAWDKPSYARLAPFFIGYGKTVPFGDFTAILLAAKCWRHGVSVYVPNLCMGGGSYNYSLFLLHLPIWPAPPGLALGCGLDILFMLSFAALPPAQDWMELALRLASCFAGVVVYAMEQANFDVVVFLLTLAGLAALARPGRQALAGYAVFLFAAACKFYPIMLLVMAMREPPRRLLAVAGAAIVCVAAFWWGFGTGTATALQVLPAGSPFDDGFGASDLPRGLPLLFFAPHPMLDLDLMSYELASDHILVPIIGIAGPFVLTVLVLARAWAAGPRYAAALQALPPARLLGLLAGGVLIAGCFLAGQNIMYRSIFLLLAQPGLWGLLSHTRGYRRAGLWVLNLAVPVLLWEVTMREAAVHLHNPFWAQWAPIGIWVFYGLLWWWVVLRFCEFLVGLGRERLGFFVNKKPQKNVTPKPP
jgi:hypothetical protein